MPESPSSSFIPKRGTGRKPVTVRKSNFIVLSIVSYAMFVSAPLASAAVFIYERHTQNQFDKAVVALDEAIVTFNEADLKRAAEFNERITQSKNLLLTHVSLVKLLDIIEDATAQTVTFTGIEIKRIDSATLAVAGTLTTSDFDGALFQRATYDTVDAIDMPVFSDVTLVKDAKAAAGKTESASERTVDFMLKFNVATPAIKYEPLANTAPAATDNPAPSTPQVSETILTPIDAVDSETLYE